MKPEVLALFLRAVALVESGDNPRAIGAAGERGRFQMAPAVVASCGGFGLREAERHERWIERQFDRARVPVVPFNLALAWNAGASAVLHGRAPEQSYRYACRVVAVMERLQREGVR